MRITIDSGHRNNINDFGAVGPNKEKESEYALRIAKVLENKLKALGHQVCMTRNSENDTIGIDQRTRVAKNFKSDWLISIHLNAFNTTANGVEVCYKNHKDKAEKLSSLMAQKTGLKNRGAKFRNDLGVLNGFTNSLLLECGFISNLNELKVINGSDFAEKIAYSVIETLGLKKEKGYKVEKIKVLINGVVTEVEAITENNVNYIKLRDIQTKNINIGYENKMPTITTV